MKFVIRRRVQRDKILKALPRRLVGRLPKGVLTENEYALILFGLDRDNITSASVRKALDQMNDVGRPVIAVGSSFTIDALGVLELNHVIVVSAHEAFFTDASFENVKTLIRSKVKAPDIKARRDSN